MMNYAEAVAYGKKKGCRYYVYNSNGGLMGGFKEKKDAEKYLDECLVKYADDKLNSDLGFYIVEK